MRPGSRPTGMRKLTQVEFAPWTLPLIVAGLIVPIVGAVLLAGPGAGFIAGAAVAAAIVVLAARARYDEPIEVAASSDRRYHLLVVVTEAVAEPPAVEAIAAAVARGAGRGGDPDAGADVLVLAPALNPRLSHWLSDLRGARLAAQERLAVSLAALATAGVEAHGKVGDTDPVQAVEDTLASYPAQEVVFVTRDQKADALGEVRRRLDRPLRHVVAGRLDQPLERAEG